MSAQTNVRLLYTSGICTVLSEHNSYVQFCLCTNNYM